MAASGRNDESDRSNRSKRRGRGRGRDGRNRRDRDGYKSRAERIAERAAREALMRAELPLVALVGRPNVGKSRLFNRLVGGRDAIVEDTPGVTRDRNYGRVEWYGKGFTAVDTGGFEPDAEDVLLEQMREQAQLAIDDADAIIFVVDGLAGMLPGDKMIANMLRKSETPVYVAVNKLDVADKFDMAAEFYALGLPEVFPVSAEHGLGIDDLVDRLVEPFESLEDLAAKAEEAAAADVVQVAVVGKPNAGKSTLINRLLGADRLLTSEIPGTTRDAIDTLLEREEGKYMLIDTAGMRRKRSISHQLEKYSVVQAIRSLERADVALFVMDAIEGVTDQDARIVRLAVDRGCALVILLNKWDAIPERTPTTADEYREIIHVRLPFCDWAPILTLSALTGQRAHRVLDLVDEVYRNARRRISTGQLNRTLERIVAAHQPPAGVTHRPTRFYYMTQVGVAPPTFVAQVNQPSDVPESYRRYVVNQLREIYGFEGTPIRLIVRKPRGRHRWNES